MPTMRSSPFTQEKTEQMSDIESTRGFIHTYRLHVKQLLLCGWQHQFALVGTHGLEYALKDCPFIPGSLPWRPWVLVRLKHWDSALLAHILHTEIRPCRLYVEYLLSRALIQLLDTLSWRSLAISWGWWGHLISGGISRICSHCQILIVWRRT